MAMDSQQIGIIGRQILIANLLAAGLEVAVPIRDRGIDLIVYQDRADDDFKACPLQIKTASDAVFVLDKKYENFKGLWIVFVWNAKEPQNAELFALTYAQASTVLSKMKYDQTKSWEGEDGRYTTTRPSVELKEILRKEFQIKEAKDWPVRLRMNISEAA